ncbi:hypothetical protein KJ693_03830 [bacterium]|nr:hypothetical protein [bacterium]
MPEQAMTNDIGFERGLKEWRHLIKPNGFLAVHEMAWLRPDPPQEIYDYWKELYPGIRTVPENLEQNLIHRGRPASRVPRECAEKETIFPKTLAILFSRGTHEVGRRRPLRCILNKSLTARPILSCGF